MKYYKCEYVYLKQLFKKYIYNYKTGWNCRLQNLQKEPTVCDYSV